MLESRLVIRLDASVQKFGAKSEQAVNGIYALIRFNNETHFIIAPIPNYIYVN